MLRQFLRKRVKLARGAWNTYIVKKGRVHDNRDRWDELHYVSGVSDRQTLSPGKSEISARYHYCSVEMRILRHLRNRGFSAQGAAVLDIGSGAGHWIDFYKSLGSARTTGIDVSRSSADYLRARYAGHPDVTVLCGKAADVLTGLEGKFDIVSAIGVMFHIVQDPEWADTIERIAAVMNSGALLVVGGHFGLLGGLNVQLDENGQVNKRLRSRNRWRTVLGNAGFRDVRIYRNFAYLWIDDVLPENHVLTATR